MLTVTRRPVRAMSPRLVVSAMLSALILFAMVAVTSPGEALGASTLSAKCTANLRTSAKVTAKLIARIPTGTKVTAVASVTGGSWRTTCAGSSVSGTKWYRISAINGKSVSSRYGVSYLYAASGLFKVVPIVIAMSPTAMVSSCAANLRTSTSVTSTLKQGVPTGTKVTVVAEVQGGTWSTACPGVTTPGSRWYRITAVNGKSVSSLYGVSYVYGAKGLFKPAAKTLYASCSGVNVRSSASTDGTLKTKLTAGTPVTVVATVTGSSWSTTCADTTVAGSTWHRISAIGGKSISSLYSTSYLYAASGLFAATPPGTSTEPPPPPPPPAGTTTEGIDVSHWQGTIDWAKVRAAGKRFAFIKASEDTSFVDSKYATNRSKAKAAGILVGAYHFAKPSSSAGDAVAEADHFVRTAAVLKGELVPVLDLEVTGGLSSSALQTWTRSFLTRVYEKTGLRSVIYVSPAFWRNSMGDSTWFAANGYKFLWTAHWTSASTPSVPGGNWGGNGWTFWQYSSTGTVPGISGRVDLNRYNGTDFRPVLVP